MKKFILALIVITVILCGCGKVTEDGTQTVGNSGTTNGNVSEQLPEPSSNDELYTLLIDSLKSGNFDGLYQFAGDNIKVLMTEDDFAYMLSSLYNIGGGLVTDEHTVSVGDNGDTYTAALTFNNMTADLTVVINNVKIDVFVRNIYFDNTFELTHDGITERYFVFENDGFKLNAVYTYASSGETGTAVLLISGSGPSDYNETVGILTPFEDIARALAEQGISSLRFDKRTLNYASEFTAKAGHDEEYFSDCNAAIEYLMGQEGVTEVSLLGHSLGGQIAAKLAEERDDVASMVLLNSSSRHLADILADQYTALDPANKATYLAYADSAKNASAGSLLGQYYYGVSDYYWASYNLLDTVESVKSSGIPTLIINSRADQQSFDEDIKLWEDALGDSENVTIYIDREISHFGYVFDGDAASEIYHLHDMPGLLTDMIGEFLADGSK